MHKCGWRQQQQHRAQRWCGFYRSSPRSLLFVLRLLWFRRSRVLGQPCRRRHNSAAICTSCPTTSAPIGFRCCRCFVERGSPGAKQCMSVGSRQALVCVLSSSTRTLRLEPCHCSCVVVEAWVVSHLARAALQAAGWAGARCQAGSAATAAAACTTLLSWHSAHICVLLPSVVWVHHGACTMHERKGDGLGRYLNLAQLLATPPVHSAQQEGLHPWVHGVHLACACTACTPMYTHCACVSKARQLASLWRFSCLSILEL